MDFFTILETFGLPVAMVIALGFYISKKDKSAEKQMDWVRNELATENRETAARHEGIVIKLIEQQKIMQENQAKIHAKISAVIEIMVSLSGNGLKEKFSKKNSTKIFPLDSKSLFINALFLDVISTEHSTVPLSFIFAS